MLVLEHVPAESLLALCETSREFGVLAREVGAARMKHAPRWAARALYGIGNPLHQLALAERAQQICDSWSDAHAEIRHCEEHGRCRQLRRGVVTRAQVPAPSLCAAQRTAPSPRSVPSLTPPPPPPPQLRADPTLQAGEGGAGGSACDARYPELLSAMAFGMRAAATLAAARRAHAAAEARGLADTPGFPRLHEAPMFGTPEFPALVRLARCKNARVLVAVVLHEDAGASSIAAKALGQLCAAPSPRALAVSSLVDALLHGGDHEKPQGARALQEMARRDKEAIGAMLSSEAIPGTTHHAAAPSPLSPRTPHHAPLF